MKSIPIKFVNITSTLGATYTQGAQYPTQVNVQFPAMDVLCVVNTITGVTGTAGFSMTVQELFGDAYVQTARISNITSSSQAFIAAHDIIGTINTYATPSVGSNALLGKGSVKRIVTTADGNLTALNADIYFVLWDK